MAQGSPNDKTAMPDGEGNLVTAPSLVKAGQGVIFHGDVIEAMAWLSRQAGGESYQLIIADPPYFQVLVEQEWDTSWKDEREYLDWTVEWVRGCRKLLREDGLMYIFGQLGKREHVWLHVCSTLAQEMQFHDMIIWDRVVGYNLRGDSFTPQYEMILALRHKNSRKVFFDKDGARVKYPQSTIDLYMKDKRYKNLQARREHLQKGKYATNILSVPSLKGSSGEKVGHPSQKPLELITHLMKTGSREGDLVLDPFLGSGSTAVVAERCGRRWHGVEKDAKYVKMAKKRLDGSPKGA